MHYLPDCLKFLYDYADNPNEDIESIEIKIFRTKEHAPITQLIVNNIKNEISTLLGLCMTYKEIQCGKLSHEDITSIIQYITAIYKIIYSGIPVASIHNMFSCMFSDMYKFLYAQHNAIPSKDHIEYNDEYINIIIEFLKNTDLCVKFYYFLRKIKNNIETILERVIEYDNKKYESSIDKHVYIQRLIIQSGVFKV